MASFPFIANTPSDTLMTDVNPVPPPANITPTPTVGAENSDHKPEPDKISPFTGNQNNGGNRPGEPEWVTHSGIEGRPYITEEIYESPKKVELEGDDRCKRCIELDRPCFTILKFPNPPANGDLDLCGYCAKDSHKVCGAGKKAYKAHIRKLVEDDGEDAISKRRARRISNKPLSPDMTATPDQSAKTHGRARSSSSDSDTTIESAPKRQKVAFRKKPGPKPKPKTPKAESSTSTSAPASDNAGKYDGRKDPAKVALRVEKMKATLAAKKAEKEAAAQALVAKAAASPKGKAAAKATPRAKIAAPEPKAHTLPKPALKKPRSVQTPIRTRGPAVAPEDDFLSKDFVGTAPEPINKRGAPARKIIDAHRRVRATRPDATQSDRENEINALLGSIEPRISAMDDEEDDDNTSGTSNFDDLEMENQNLQKTLAKLEAREKKLQLREENETMKKRIDELRRKSIGRRESSGVLTS